jgi:transcriptional regulator with XRE-family HTH domain
MQQNIFGERLKELRQKKGLSLRAFSLKCGKDPGNISRVERGLLPPPKLPRVLEQYADALNLRDKKERREFFDLAAIGAGRLPGYVMNNQELIGKLPLFLRTLEGQPLDQPELDTLVKLIRGA